MIQVQEIMSYKWECPNCKHENLNIHNHGCICEKCDSGFEADEIFVNKIKQNTGLTERTELKDCPNCDGLAEVLIDGEIEDTVYCMDCGLGIIQEGNSYEDFAAIWNDLPRRGDIKSNNPDTGNI